MSVCSRCNRSPMSSMKKRGRRQRTKLIHAWMESVMTRRQIYSYWWRPTTCFPSAAMQPIRSTRFLSCRHFVPFCDQRTPSFTYFGLTLDRPTKPVRLAVQQPQLNQSQCHQPTHPSLAATQRSAAAAAATAAAATIDQLRDVWFWPSSLPLLVALIVVVSDFLVLLALVFHLFESPSTLLLPSSSVTSVRSALSPIGSLVPTVSPCDQVVSSLFLASKERESCSREQPALLSAAWTYDGTVFSIWILDSVLLGCAVLCRLVRTSSLWLRRRSKCVSLSFLFQTHSKLNCFSKRASGGGGQFNDGSQHRVNFLPIHRFNVDGNPARRRNGQCDVTRCDRWHCRWPYNNIHGARPLADDMFTPSRSHHRRRGGLWWPSLFPRRQWRPRCSDLDRNVANDPWLEHQSDLSLAATPLPRLTAENATRLVIEKNQLGTSFGRRTTGLSSSPNLSSSCLAIMLVLSSLSSVAVSSSTAHVLWPAMPAPSTSTGSSPSSASAHSPSSFALTSDRRLPLTESLNPWLAADGGLILRAATGNTLHSSPLNWVRPNPGSCIPQPTIAACPSDRFCRLPETAGSFGRHGRSFPVPFAQASASLPTKSNGSSENGVQHGADDAVNRDWPLNSRATATSAGRERSDKRLEGRRSASADGAIADDDGLSNVDASAAKASQCLPYLQPGRRQPNDSDDDRPSSAECICGHADGARRIDTLRKYYLHHCYHYSLWHVLSDTMREGIAMSRSQCYTYLDAVERLDNLAAHFVCQFDDVIRRYDCGQTFSSKSSCQQCKVAYRQWVCSMVLPMWLDGERVKPCRTFCHEVERLCPYFLPAEKSGPGSQYAGEPSFLCIDPGVRETINQSTNSAYSERSCYRPCTLEYNLEPDIDPSLCVASLGDISGLVEEDEQAEAIPDKECHEIYKNLTASTSKLDTELPSVKSEDHNDQCSPFLGQDPWLTSTLSSKGWSKNLHFVWPWRTLALPFAMLPIIMHYFT